MIRIALAAVFCLPIQMIAQQPVSEIKFHAQTDFFKLPPELYFGEAAGVAVNSKGHVFVFSRGGTTGPAYGAAAAQLFEFDADGKYIREIGRHLYAWSFAHAVKVDKEDANIWVADKGSDMVIKFNPEGRILRWSSAANRVRAPMNGLVRSNISSRPCRRSMESFAR